ncbi:hypothetical protein L208DRAFT_1366639 [Tricholoma matsutake]|nr:hypothetical protein L208DRAFT_1366639 [Tricholoma matsutake 945]
MQSRPLSETNPELFVFESPGIREYRVENRRLCRVGNGNMIEGAHNFNWQDISILVAFLYLEIRGTFWASCALGVLVLLRIWLRCTQVLSESVVIFPPHGVQLESRHGLPALPLFTMRRFIPLTTLQDVVINEGLRRWDVRHYLATIKQVGPKSSMVEAAYENLLPHQAVLRLVYGGIHDFLLSVRRSPLSDL